MCSPARPSDCFSFSSARRRSAKKSSVRKRQKAKQHVRGGIGEDHEAEELVLCKLKSQTWHSIWHSNTFPSKFFLVFSFFPILSSYADGILHISGISQKCGKLKDFQSHHKFLFEVSFWHF